MACQGVAPQFELLFETHASLRTLLKLADRAFSDGDQLLAEKLIEAVYGHYPLEKTSSFSNEMKRTGAQIERLPG